MRMSLLGGALAALRGRRRDAPVEAPAAWEDDRALVAAIIDGACVGRKTCGRRCMRKVTFLPILIFQALIALPLGVAVLVAVH